ncbi:hypothetical protein C900_05168 [Fulvivirga imtechensis AK7]|uniref:Uncharacterized protein n=1 Tax=Fulvivirga imtechensis AK7 TaxID=1237149 RepID=L8JP66_9BACT|nr:hypothetical protein [Fulvivirga imtechensis]ELR69284.1 hypothetical protein C900_05168 [Fulvivirga imtechensis AK7]
MIKLAKKIAFILTLALLLGLMLFFFFDKPLPEGEEGPAADQLADKMLRAVNYQAWESTVAAQWTFFRGHNFLWDKKRNLVRVLWDDFQVLLRTTDQSGKAFKNGKELSGDEASEALKTAWEYFANDSFWLAAPFKVYDPGTSRKLVKTDRGDALLVSYASGGVTPGDSYLWILDDDGTPQAWQLWVRIIPVGGMEFSWEGWETYENGVKLSNLHDGIMDIKISDIKLAMEVSDLNDGIDPFQNM